MDKLILYYSVLRYIPSSIRMESINIGIAIHVPALKLAHFFKLKNTKRVSAFDDEYDKDFFAMTMDSLRYDINYPVDEDMKPISLGYESRFDDIESSEFLYAKTHYLSNEFQFSPIQTVTTNKHSLMKDIDSLKKTFLYYDRPKSQRVTKAEVRRLLSKSLNSYNLTNLEKSPNIKGDFSDKPIFDYRVGDKYIKAISFDYAHQNTMATELKSTLYDINTIISNNSISEVILTTDDSENSKSRETFISKVKELKGNHKIDIKIVPLSEFYQNLNK